MWYVNQIYHHKWSFVSNGFILTMWYVNSIDPGPFLAFNGFILTMWYVNL